MSAESKTRNRRPALRRLLGAAACIGILLGGDLAAGTAAASASSAERNRSRLSQTMFYTMEPFTVPLLDNDVVVEHFTLVIALELADPDKRSAVFHMVPRLRDAFYRVLFRMVTFRRKGSPIPHVDAFKKNLYNVAHELAGSELVTSLLVQQAFKRPLR
jgi:hypothetical protein